MRPARQTRSQRTLEKLLDAAEAVIGEKGIEDAGVVETADRPRRLAEELRRRLRAPLWERRDELRRQNRRGPIQAGSSGRRGP